MKEIVRYLKEIEAEIMERDSEVDVAEVPEILQDFYRKIESVDLPFGRIYELEFALNNSKRMPFYPEWFVFGQDNYSSFWLCYRGKSEDGCYFTYWDHESAAVHPSPPHSPL